MRKGYLVITLLLTLSLSSCLDSILGEMKQVFPDNDLSRVKKLEIYNYALRNSRSVTDSTRIKWYTDFFKDSTNYYRKESIDRERGEKATYRITFISKEDTLDLSVYPAKSRDKIVAAFLDPYDPNDPWKFRRYNRFYIHDQVLDSLKANLK
ncbi:hypothetical protein CXF67_03300 [Psychroflexus sp. MES1-P1E]|nr:hypothetical protein CXF67_03300 [Psychroflexus sp. MES1-P1E]